MLTIIVGIACLFIGWNLPQPSWAKWVQAKITALWNKPPTDLFEQ